MKKFSGFVFSSGKFILLCAALCALSTSLFAAGANGPWGSANISVGVVVQSGITTSAWEGAGRNDLTGNATSFFTAANQMTPLGDGTYQLRLDLIPGAVYNYLFSARVNTAMGGLAAGTAQPEPCPNTGSDAGTFISVSSTTVNQPATGSIGYTSVGGDGRRILTMPTDLAQGTTVYLFHNFASTPTGVANYSTNIGANYVDLNWSCGLGYWGGGAPALDTLGGSYALYVATSAPTNAFTSLGTLSGQATYYRHAGLTPGTSYYYIFVSSDSYAGATNPAAKSLWANLKRADMTWAESQYTTNDKTALPSNPIPVYFKVENIDAEHSKTGSIVYLTPADVDGRLWPYKMSGVLIQAYVPETGRF